MIFDSHAHYSVFQFQNQFPFLEEENGTFIRNHGTRKELFLRMQERGIGPVIEPSVRFENIDAQMAFAKENSDFVFSAVGVHPKYCLYAPWEEREKLRKVAMENQVIAIGETGFDFSIALTEADRETQKNWFYYQIGLARELSLPLILHTRDADTEVLRILEQERFSFGGVAHCFGGDTKTAEAYIRLGFSLGIGGKLLQNNAQADILRETVREIPLSAILLETDAPYVYPNLDGTNLSKKQKQTVRNSSLILPKVMEEIARLQGVSKDIAEKTVYENTLRVFGLRERGMVKE